LLHLLQTFQSISNKKNLSQPEKKKDLTGKKRNISVLKNQENQTNIQKARL
jgi:hypothetical protein